MLDMIRAGALDTAYLRGLLDGMLDAGDPRRMRLADAESRATRGLTPGIAAQWRRTAR